MKITIEGSTKPGNISTKEEFEVFSGRAAGICYMKDDFKALKSEPVEKTLKRASGTKFSGHHSVFDHNYINLYLDGIPKALAMVINNEKMYTTSEKSARYTKMKLKGREDELYQKWVDIFKREIISLYAEKYTAFFTPLRIDKLAMENARYLISVYTPTSMMYTVSYRQLNYLYGFIENEVNKKTHHKFFEPMIGEMKEFLEELKKTGYIDDVLVKNNKGRDISIITKHKPVEYFGDVYITSYDVSFVSFGEAVRHRTLSYSFDYLKKPKYFVPPIIEDNKELKEEWLRDIDSLKENVPQGMLIRATESGTMDNFILKMMERKCSFALLEINNSTNNILKKYIKGLEKINHPRLLELKSYTKGARCTFKNFVCTSPCGFALGVIEKRKI